MRSLYHSGEIKVQAQAGAEEAALGIGRMILPVIAHAFIDFIQHQPMVIISSSDGSGMAWASTLLGPPGFMRVVDERTLLINTTPDESDPLYDNLRDGAQVGLIAIDFSTRRRLRLNGSVVMGTNGITVLVHQVYANCPRYIQVRTCNPRHDFSPSSHAVQRASALNTEMRQLIGNADTFFLASYHPIGGADASHRGGFPGFVQVINERTLAWPDYNGNGMFNSLGNIIENPNAGLLFLDFEQGGTLQLSGTANIIWDRERVDCFPGAERVIEFNILNVIRRESAMPFQWIFVEYSPENPWFC